MLIQAHRGASSECPENTLAAFRRAIELGADGIELDIHKVYDGSLVVHHDSSLKRCLGVDRSIYELTGEEIRAYNFEKIYGKAYKEEHVPYLSEVLALVKQTNLFLNIEIKAEYLLTGIEYDLLEMLYQYQMHKRCIISSYHHDLLVSIKKTDSAIPVGALYHSAYGYDPSVYAARWGFDAIHPQFASLSEKIVQSCHAKGIKVNPYTVDSSKDMLLMQRYGVDSIITNDVAFAKKTLKKFSK